MSLVLFPCLLLLGFPSPPLPPPLSLSFPPPPLYGPPCHAAWLSLALACWLPWVACVLAGSVDGRLLALRVWARQVKSLKQNTQQEFETKHRCVQKGVIYIPKSVKEDRMRENLAVFDWTLGACRHAPLLACFLAPMLPCSLRLLTCTRGRSKSCTHFAPRGATRWRRRARAFCLRLSTRLCTRRARWGRGVTGAEGRCGGADDDDLLLLDALTSPEALATFKALYIKCVTRDTPIAGTELGPAFLLSSFSCFPPPPPPPLCTPFSTLQSWNKNHFSRRRECVKTHTHTHKYTHSLTHTHTLIQTHTQAASMTRKEFTVE